MKNRFEQGFTLIEVLVALVIFSIAIIGLTHAGTQSLRTTDILRQKTYAGVVADNQIVLARNSRAELGVNSGEEEAGGFTFEWELETSETEMADFLQIIVKVRNKDTDLQLIDQKAFRLRETRK